ncbi:MAG: apolipoprotein N-acyltransferase [Proteobacteria bacterium]|nr:apolipoprotein N-acyltransferase [Pseudomonadota bacterium]
MPPRPALSADRSAIPPLTEFVLAAALGACASLPFVHTWAWWVQIGLFALVAARVGRAGPGRAAAIGVAFGTAWLAAGTWWLYISMHRYGGLPAVLAVAAVAVLSVCLSLYAAAAFALFARWKSGRPGIDALRFAALWLLAELARGVIFTGFPWIETAYAQVDGPLAALAPWVGAYGIGAVVAGLGAWLGLPRAGGWRAWRRPAGITALLLVAPAVSGPGSFTEASGTLSVTLLQNNVPQDEKFNAEHLPEELDWTRRQLLAAPGDLVVGPETVIPLLPDQLDPAYWQTIARHFRTGRQSALIGLPLGNEDIGYTNSAAGLSDRTANLPGGFYRYDKHHLVPFGEFIPNGFHWFTRMMNIPLGDFNRGPLAAPSFEVRRRDGGIERVAANICYEDLFGEELAARFTDAATAPTLFANISNIGWFGDTIAVEQHLQISRLRTLEFQRPMIRATNTGPTVVIDHRGQVVAALKPYTQAVLDAVVQGRTGLTPYAWWVARTGLWPWLVLAVVVLWPAWRAARAATGRRL